MKVSVKLSLLCVAVLATSSFASLVWTEATDSAGWSKRCGQGTVVFNNELWVMGGMDSVLKSQGQPFNDVWHSSDGTHWTLATDSAGWSRRILPTCLVFGGKMWVIGGVASGQLLSDVWSSTDGSQWTKVTDSAGWHPRLGQAGVAFDSMMWIMGGADSLDSSGPLEDVNDVWNSSDGAHWTRVTAAAQWSPRDGHAAVVFGGWIWVLGGEASRRDTSDVWYTTNGTAWSEETPSAGWAGRAFFQVLLFGPSMLVLGGCGSFAPVYGDDWSFYSGQWSEDTSQNPWRARYAFGGASLNERIWVMGGADSTGVRHDVWYCLASGVAEGPVSPGGRNVGLRASPNPFRGETKLACGLTGAYAARIWIQDVSGRRIRELVADSRKPGVAGVVWDGRDAVGRDVPAGVYFALVSTGGHTDETMVVKLK